MKRSCKLILFSILCIANASLSYAREHQIYSVAEEVPMGYPDEIQKKNYYMDIGEDQGVEKGTILSVFRTISKLNPYENQKRINHRVKIGELKVLHADKNASIGALNQINKGADMPLFEIENFMIGDHVSVSVSN